jgi:hypothetical protein
MFSVDVQTKPTFTFGQPTALPIKGIITSGGPGNPRGYDITPDGKYFLVMLPATDAESTQRLNEMYITLHWFED